MTTIPPSGPRAMPTMPTKRFYPKPNPSWDFGAPAYHHEVMKRNNDNALKKWENDVASEEIDFRKRLQIWETNKREEYERRPRTFTVHKKTILKKAQEIIEVNKMVRELERQEQLRIYDMVRADIAAMTIKIQSQKQSDPTSP